MKTFKDVFKKEDVTEDVTTKSETTSFKELFTIQETPTGYWIITTSAEFLPLKW
jgi:hypothetical protein